MHINEHYIYKLKNNHQMHINQHYMHINKLLINYRTISKCI